MNEVENKQNKNVILLFYWFMKLYMELYMELYLNI